MKRRLLILVVGLVLMAHAGFGQYKLYEDGLSRYESKRYPECISLLTEFLSKSMRDKKFDVDAYYYRALAYYKSDDFEKAINDFQECVLLNRPNKGNIYWFMAKSNVKLSAKEDAISNYTNAIKEIGSEPESKAKLLFERSQLYEATANISSAIDDLNSASVLSPANKEVRTALDRLNTQYAASRGAASKDAPAVVTKEVATTKTPEKKTIEKKIPEKQVAQTDKPADKPAPQVEQAPEQQVAKIEKKAEVITAPVVQAPVVPAEPTLADLYGDERRFALVIGNSKYSKEVGVLKNPVNDATDIAKELRDSNFEVTLLTDATYGQMRANMLRFKERIDAGDPDKTVALFYYAGHGLQHEDENYLVPVDAALEYEDDIARYCFPIQRMVLANMERSNARMNIVILDACRNNPFPSLTRSVGNSGLGEMKRARGSFIAYATAPGSVAADGDGRNGLYTQELLKAMRKPKATIEQVFKEVRQSVLRHSGNRQNTWDSSNIVGDFYFKLQ